MKIHSEFLVHWTGSDIESQRNTDKPGLYLNRLLDDYANGLFAKRTSEAVVRRMKIKNIVRWCFTEIRLSQAHRHAERFGRLGIGFSREFIVNKGGRPVIYIPYDAPENSRLLDDSIRNVANLADELTAQLEERPDLEELVRKLKKSSKSIMAHVKRMGNDRAHDEHFEEMEWRVVYDENPENQHFTQAGRSIHRLQFDPADVRLLIFPDDLTRNIAFENEMLKTHVAEHSPITATLRDCGHF